MNQGWLTPKEKKRALVGFEPGLTIIKRKKKRALVGFEPRAWQIIQQFYCSVHVYNYCTNFQCQMRACLQAWQQQMTWAGRKWHFTPCATKLTFSWQKVICLVSASIQDAKMWNASRICVSSLRRGHANLLCIVPILVCVVLCTTLTSCRRRYLHSCT